MNKQKITIFLFAALIMTATPAVGMRFAKQLGGMAQRFVTRATQSFPQWASLFNASKSKTSSGMFSRMRNSAKTEQTGNSYKQSKNDSDSKNQYRTWNNRATFGSQLTGVLGSRWFWASVNDDKDNPIFSRANIDKYTSHEAQFIDYAVAGLSTDIADEIAAIIRLMEKSPQALTQISAEIVKRFDSINSVEIVKAALKYNKNPDFVGQVIKVALENRKTNSLATALCVGAVIDAYPVIVATVKPLLAREFALLHGYVVASMVRNDTQLTQQYMPQILRSNVETLKRMLDYEYFVKSENTTLRSQILNSALENHTSITPSNLSLLFMYMDNKAANKLKKASADTFGGQSGDLPAHALYALYNKRYLFSDLEKPAYLYKNFDADKVYTKDELFSAAMRDVAVTKPAILGQIYGLFHGNKHDEADINRTQKLCAHALEAYVCKDAEQANKFLGIVQGTLSQKEREQFEANKPYFVTFPQFWRQEDIKKVVFDSVDVLSVENLDYAYFHLMHAHHEKEALKNSAKKRFGQVTYAKITPNLITSLYRKKFEGLKLPGFLVEEYVNKQYSKEDVIRSVLQDPLNVSIDNLNYVYYRLMDNQSDRDALKQLTSQRYGLEKLQLKDALKSNKQIDKPAFLYECSYLGEKGSQTEQHFSANMVRIFYMMQRHKTVDNIHAQNMLLDAHNVEMEELQKGNHVFYHGSQWQWDFIRRMDRIGFNLVAKPGQQLGENQTRFRFDGSETDGLCMNYALLGNANDDTSGTASYVLRNHDYSSPERMKAFATQKLFERHHLGSLYNQHKTDFDELERLHRAANPHNLGSLIVISVPDKDVHHVFPAQAATMGRVVKPIVVNGSATTDIRVILQALKTKPETIQYGESDLIEFAARLNNKYFDKPNEQWKTIAVGAWDKDKWAEYLKKEAELSTKLSASLQHTKWR